MPLTESTAYALDRRARCYRAGYGYYNCRNRWSDWGRWVVLAGVIVIVLVIFMLCTCTARRRRRRGNPPMYGTGWLAPGGKHNTQHQMNDYQQGNYNQAYPQQNGPGYASQQGGHYNPPPPPAYGQQPQNTGNTFNPNDGYYSQQPQDQHYGVQPPHGTYQRDTTYAPPAGPPPNK
ncbi:hypothetical protein E4U30_000297 [Claviceps sp. LM220 group G6]|nr:hypothetical protein E4U15_006178 [Claviceps sp. LM218 group G6]KAG6088377.1 hypothetical protein E4U30_000297 [Claviceps sp. LM220 group G6]KAG6095393.1 hypothetical protein E4U31_005894 [Claviceps sp. LM219 group G6]KAG6101519.1 hypothetical protein E4U14_006840 [Claviceps sp. LM454 group G7]